MVQWGANERLLIIHEKHDTMDGHFVPFDTLWSQQGTCELHLSLGNPSACALMSRADGDGATA